MSEAPDARVPVGYELVRPHIGQGKTSRVALLRREADGSLFAWKVPLGDDERIRADLAAQVERSQEWVRLGCSTAAAEWAPDGGTLLQPYVDGTPMATFMRQDPEFFTRLDDPRIRALIDFLARLVAASTYLSGLNGHNLIYDGERYQVVDSGTWRRLRSPRAAWYRQRLSCLRKWPRGRFAAHEPAIRTFLAAAEAALPPEHRRGLGLRLLTNARRLLGRGG